MFHWRPALFSIFIFFSFHQASAYKVLDIRNGKMLVDLEGEEVERGDYLENLPEAEEQGQAIVLQLRPGQAVCRVRVGNFNIGDQVKRVKGEASFDKDAIKVSLQVKYLSNGISVKQKDGTIPTPNSETVNMTGSSIGGFVVVDWPTDWFMLRGGLGLEPVEVSGKARYNVCKGKTSTECTANINYIAASAQIRYDFYRTSHWVTWIGAGSGIKYPMNKTSTSLNKGAIGIANSIMISGGADYLWNRKYFVPVGAEYHYSLNYSEKVPVISQFTLHAGIGMQF